MAKEEGLEWNPAGVAEMMASPAMVAGLKEIVDRGKGFARQIAPVRTGKFRDSIESDVVIEHGIANGILFSTDWRANVLEKGGTHGAAVAPAHHTFGRSVDFMAGGTGEAVHGNVGVQTDQGLV